MDKLSGEALERARTALHTAIDLEAAAERSLRPVRKRHHRRMVRRTVGIGIGFAAAAAAVALVVVTTVQPQASPHGQASSISAAVVASAPLMHLADNITAKSSAPAGDSTLVLRTTTDGNKAPYNGVDLYTDSGRYYYAPTTSGLPSAIAATTKLGSDNSVKFRGDGSMQAVAVAISAASGDLSAARAKMADLGGIPKPNRVDGWVWENSLDALVAGAGNSQARAGVLRILSTLPEVAVTNTTTQGQPTLTLALTSPTIPNYQETMTINASTGIPVLLTGGEPGRTPDDRIAYQISRVNLADISAGKF
ncbi:MAG: hypothetical protein ABI400_06325 [Lacisediminihabitans sp.]